MTLEGEYVPSPSRWVRDQVELYESSGGERGSTFMDTGMPVILMTTRGHKSGAVRKSPLMRVEHDGEYALVGSKGGGPTDPLWVRNLEADPKAVTIRDGTEVFDAEVRRVSGDERAVWWERAVAAYSHYADYQKKTEREIPSSSPAGAPDRGAAGSRGEAVAGSPYVVDYTGEFQLPRPPDDVWSAMGRFERFERWWGWLKELRVDGPGLVAGSVLHLVVVPPLPYRIRIEVDLLTCVPRQQIEVAVHGDLEGRARLDLEPDGEGTRARVASNLEVVQRPLRMAARVAPGLLRWGHERVVEATVTSFRQHLGEGDP